MDVMILKGDIARLGFDRVVLPVNQELCPLNAAGLKLAEQTAAHNWTFVREDKWPKAGEVMPASLVEKELNLYFVDACPSESKEPLYDFMVCCIWNCLARAYNETVEQNRESLSLAFSNLFAQSEKDDPKLAARAFRRVLSKMKRQYPESEKVKIAFVLDTQEDYAAFKEAFGTW